ncbi:MAG: hypothetical protein J0I49_30240 [Pseudonocardia sp.]|mgnify:CR=1 FL=1|uniref:hypothetical protein n=1 Tax=Pseudonocardia sp. TaxID=60912 RepID=UPI001AC7AB74|nr:hypothetical protein [Pseudonocardia sp.]MBN9102346.1 hypothetical protein [Pseudonocardia sp.]
MPEFQALSEELHVTALDALREKGDELRDDLVDEIRCHSHIVSETTFELDDELADVNYAAVAQGLGTIVDALKAPDRSLDELVELLSVRFPDEPPPPPPEQRSARLPERPVPVDPHTMEIDEDEEYDRYHLMSEQFANNVNAQTWHLRALMQHAADLLDRLVDATGRGAVAEARQILAERRPLIEALAATLLAWEIAISALDQFTGSGGGLAGEQIHVTERWLSGVADRAREATGE